MVWRGLLLLIVAGVSRVYSQATTTTNVPSSTLGGCTFAAVGYTNPGPLTNLAVPSTLYLTETLFNTACTQVITERLSVFIDGTTFSADPTVYTLQTAGQQFITYNFPLVTVTSLTAGQPLVFSWVMSVTTSDTEFPRGGEYTIFVPSPSPTTTSSPTSSSSTVAYETTTIPPTSTGSSGLSGGAIGGIVGGVLGGLALVALGAGIFFYKRRKDRLAPRERPDSFQYFGAGAGAGAGQAGKGRIDMGGTETEPAMQEQQPSLRYPEQDYGEGPVGGRTGGSY